MSFTRNQASPRRRAVQAVVAGAVLLGIAITLWTMSKLQPATLSAPEVRLVGTWKTSDASETGESAIFTLGADRVFRSPTGVIGQWWVENEMLRLRYWSDNESRPRLLKLIGRLRAPTESYGLRFTTEEDRIFLLPSGSPTKELGFIRVAD